MVLTGWYITLNWVIIDLGRRLVTILTQGSDQHLYVCIYWYLASFFDTEIAHLVKYFLLDNKGLPTFHSQ